MEDKMEDMGDKMGDKIDKANSDMRWYMAGLALASFIGTATRQQFLPAAGQDVPPTALID